MVDEGNQPPTRLCPSCRKPLTASTVQTAVWQGDEVALVEDIPALVCGACGEQYYDDDVSAALRKLSESGFPRAEADRVIDVPVFSLEGRIRKRRELPEDTYVD